MTDEPTDRPMVACVACGRLIKAQKLSLRPVPHKSTNRLKGHMAANRKRTTPPADWCPGSTLEGDKP